MPQVPLWVRLWHWTTAALFIALVITGAILHFAVPGFTPLDYSVSSTLHMLTGIALSAIYGLYLVMLLATGTWRHYIPVRRGFWSSLKRQVTVYTANLIRGEGPPTADAGTHLTPLQHVVYLFVLGLLLPIIVLSGLLYLYPEESPRILELDAFWPIATVHYGSSVLGTVFLILHAYMGVFGPNAARSLRLMIRGHTDPR